MVFWIPTWNFVKLLDTFFYVKRISCIVILNCLIVYINFFSQCYTLSKSIPKRYEKCLWASSSVNRKSLLTPPSGREWTKSYSTNVGGDQINPGIKILSLPSNNGLFGWRMSEYQMLQWTLDNEPGSLRYNDIYRGVSVTLFPSF